MLVGSLPFSGDSPHEIKSKIIAGNFEIPKDIKSQISKDCLDVIYRCLSVDPE